MSASSSGSWCGGADIIDLDRYMRGAVRPSPDHPLASKHSERLVVDGGAGGGKAGGRGGDARAKRYSHDSGVSDGSAPRRRVHRLHRRASGHIGEPFSSRTLSGRSERSGHGNSSGSLRAFRAACEQALRDQQRQIERLCQILAEQTQRNDKTQPLPRPDRAVLRPERVPARSDRAPSRPEIVPARAERVPARTERAPARLERAASKVECVPSSDTSDLSSSSRSTKDTRRREKHRTQECKTYKIIMTKLDELNRRFSTRPKGGPTPTGPYPRHCARSPLSSSSVSVCDKVIATDPQRPQRTYNKILAPSFKAVSGGDTGGRGSGAGSRSSRVRSRAIAHAFAVDIAPKHPPHGLNVLTESVVQCPSNGSRSRSIGGGGDLRSGVNLDDTVHLYSQSKRSRAAMSRRTRSASPPPSQTAPPSKTHSRSHATLCALCRGYWRHLRQCLLAAPVWNTVDSCKCS